MTKASVIIRFRNEATHLAAVLQAVRAQRCRQDIEIVAIDNASTDGSRAIAQDHADVLLDIDDYRPGTALNRGIATSTGDEVVVLSAHALPRDERWLSTLTGWLRNPGVLGVYGAQLYSLTTQFLDKRDLDIFTELRPRTETTDSDFWNANSALLRSSWEKEPFDETTIELEDHYWTKCVLPGSGRWVRYEPEALVYHYGHEKRNDRTFLPPSPLSDVERIDAALEVLDREDPPWPAVMSAGMTLGSLSRVPQVGRAVPIIGQYLLDHSDFDVRWRMAGALGRIAVPDSAPYLIRGLRDPSFYPRDECAWSLARLGELAAPQLLAEIAKLPSPARPFAALALGRSGCNDAMERAVMLISECLISDDRDIERDAIYFLGEIAQTPGTDELVETVIRRLDADDETARASAWCLGRLAESSAQPEPQGLHDIAELAHRHPVEIVRAEAVVALGRFARAARAPQLLDDVARSLAHDASGRVRFVAIQSLRLAAQDGCASAADVVVSHTDDPDFGVAFERQLVLGGSGRG